MNYDLWNGVSTKVRVILFGMTFSAVALPMAFIWIFAQPEPISRATVFGCYTAPGAPTLLVRNDAIHIIEPARRKFTYVAEPSKTSYQLHVEPALRLSRRSDGKYAFVETRGTGFFWALLPVEGRNRDRVRHPNEYAGRFEVGAEYGEPVVYTRNNSTGDCP